MATTVEQTTSTFDVSFISLIILLLSFVIFISESAQPDQKRLQQVLESLDNHFIAGNSQHGSDLILDSLEVPIPDSAKLIADTTLSERYSELVSLAQSGGISSSSSATTFSFIFPNDRLFSRGQDQLSTEFLPLLQKIIVEASTKRLPVAIAVHSDGVSSLPAKFPSALHLTAASAASLYRYFLDGGLAQDQLKAHGQGEHQPIASNSSPDGQAANRRTVLTLTMVATESE